MMPPPSAGNHAVQLRGRTNSKQDAKREASTLALQETLKDLLNVKYVSSENRGEAGRRRNISRTIVKYKKKRLEIDEINCRKRAKDVDIKHKEVARAHATHRGNPAHDGRV